MTTEQPVVWPLMSFAADRIAEELAPYCDRVEVAGSILRRKQYPGDVEIVCVPKPGIPEATQEQMFSANARQVEDVPDQLTKYLKAQYEGSNEWVPVWRRRLNKKGNVAGFGLKNKLMFRDWEWETATKMHVPPAVKVDIFSATTETWGAIAAIRTGPSELNQFIAVRAKKLGIKLSVREGGFILSDDEIVRCATEEKFFEMVQVPFVEPKDRTSEFIADLEQQDRS